MTTEHMAQVTQHNLLPGPSEPFSSFSPGLSTCKEGGLDNFTFCSGILPF